MEGWIKIHRKFLTWEWYQKPDMAHLFLHLLLKANSKNNTWQGIPVKRGQLITGLKTLSNETGLSIQAIRTNMGRLKITKEIDTAANTRFTLVTILKYEDYQINEKKSTHQQQAINTPSTTNKKEENIILFENNKEGKIFNEKMIEVFKEWLLYKKSKGQSYKSAKSQKMSFDKLERLSNNNPETAKRIIEDAIANNYAGFFALRNNPVSQTPTVDVRKFPNTAIWNKQLEALDEVDEVELPEDLQHILKIMTK